MPTSELIQSTTCELLDALRRFPQHVLPVGILRNLVDRGPEINDDLIERLEYAIEHAGQGAGSVPSETMFCYALLTVSPDPRVLPLLEKLIRLPETSMEDIIGELTDPMTATILVELAKQYDVNQVLDWIAQQMADEAVNPWVGCALVKVPRELVLQEMLTRQKAIDHLMTWLTKRAFLKYDVTSGSCTDELADLGAVEADALVMECFQRNQIDDGLIRETDWKRTLAERIAVEEPAKSSVGGRNDILDILQSWYGFSKTSDTLDPCSATDQAKSSPDSTFHGSSLSAEDADRYLAELRASHNQLYPRKAVMELKVHVDQVADRLIDELRWGLANVTGPDPRSSNGPFLALALLTLQDSFLPHDLMLDLIDLTDDQILELFGDTMHEALIILCSNSALGDTGAIDERIADSGRSPSARGMLAMFYVYSAWRGYLTREEAISKLVHWLQLFADEEEPLPQMVAEALCLMSPQEQLDLVQQALDDGPCGIMYGVEEARALATDPERAEDEIFNRFKLYCNFNEVIERSGMFDNDVIRPPAPVQRETPLVAPPELNPTTTVRRTEEKLGRNDPCSCGSGNKYKKCCLRG